MHPSVMCVCAMTSMYVREPTNERPRRHHTHMIDPGRMDLTTPHTGNRPRPPHGRTDGRTLKPWMRVSGQAANSISSS